MQVEIIGKEKDFIEVKFTGMDEGLAGLIVEKLNDAKVDFAAYSLDHPLTGNPVVRVKSGKPKEDLVAAIKAVEEEAGTLIKTLSKAK